MVHTNIVDTPLISIITVCYNAANDIEETILSVINQTYEKIEYIVVDGGSKDGTIDIVQKYENHIAQWISEPDDGIYDAMNKGIEVANGEWVYFLNAGDVLAHANVLQQMEKHITPDIRILRGNILRIYPKYKIKSVGVTKQNPGLIDMFNNTFHHQACLIQTSLFNEYGLYSVDYKLCSDWIFFFDCIVFHKIKSKYIDFVVAHFKMNGISSTNPALYQKEREDYLIKIYGNELFNLLSELSLYRKSKLIRDYFKIRQSMIKCLSQKNINRYKQFRRYIISMLGLRAN